MIKTNSLAPTLRRATFWALVFGATAVGVTTLALTLAANGYGVADALLTLLFAISFFWISLTFWTGFIGFLIRVLSSDPVAYVAPPARVGAARLDPATRVAVVMPVHNEDVARVYAGLEACYRSLRDTGQSRGFRFFLLSDSTDPATIRAEQRYYRDARRTHRFGARLSYLRRGGNRGGKTANIAHFCRLYRDQFDYMAVLDADSVMSGPTLVRLAAMLDARPTIGIVQAARRVVNQHTPFARLLQFGLRTTTDLFTLGQCFWQAGHGAYSGHNAMIRLAPFIRHCKLPVLPGSGPLSGQVLSHDFVESALMCRAGFEVWNLPDSSGSFEEVPTNMVDYAARDRRWCQGNLQHLRLVTLPGLPLACRAQLLTGALAYLSSAVWLLLLALSLSLALYDYRAGDAASLIKAGYSAPLIAATVLMLLLPKLLAALLNLVDPVARRVYGGGAALARSALLEIPLAALLAPVLMLHHTGAVASLLAGRSIRWTAQPRDSRRLGAAEAFARHRPHALLGLFLLTLLLLLAPQRPMVWWLIPIALGLLLAAPLAVWSSCADAGRGLRRQRLFLTPEELRPPAELAHLNDAGVELRGVA